MPRWSKARVVLLGASLVTVLVLAAGGFVLRAAGGEGSYRQVVTFSEVLSLILENYVDAPDSTRLMSGAYEGLLAGLDANGAYLEAAEVEAWRRPVPERAAGPGLVGLKAGGSFQIVVVAPGSSAEAAGLEPGDQIRAIDGIPVRGESLPQLARKLLGPAGSKVRLTVIRPSEGFRRDEFELVRQARKDAPFSVDLRGRVAVLTPNDLSRLVDEEIRAALRKAREDGANRLLVDLRNVSTPDVREASGFLGVFTEGPVLRLKDKKGAVAETLEVPADRRGWDGPVAVLVGGATAGCGEALAQVLRATRSAVVYGESTYGLGTEPRLIPLPGGDGLLVPAYVWEPVGAPAWARSGVEPDRVIRGEGRPEEVEADQLRRAVDVFSEMEVEAERKAA
jgi:carboxyl-terminal processing protease